MPIHADISKVVKYTDGAAGLPFNGSTSGLVATNTQDALDEALQRDSTIEVTDLPVANTVADSDILMVVDNSGGTPVLKQVTASTLKTYILS